MMSYKYHEDVIRYYIKWRKHNGDKLNRKARERYRKNLVKEKSRQKLWRFKNKTYMKNYMDKYSKIYRKKHPKIIAKRMSLWRLKVKDEVFNYYGGYECSCCNETTKEFLTIDHIKPKKNKSEREKKSLYVWIKAHDFPKGFRVMCYNCNLGRRTMKFGVCPHEALK